MADLQASETHDDSRERAGPPIARREPQLVLALECDRPSAGAARYSLAGVQQVLIGRGETRTAVRETRNGYTTLRLQVPARSMSSVHARLVPAHGYWILEDASSRNGSFVNGKRTSREAVGEADVIEVGRALLVVRGTMEMREAPPDLDSATLAERPSGFRTLLPPLSAELTALGRLASADVPILLRGETGTGKEVLARGIHRLSGRSGPFVAVNCGGLSRSLVEAQLFGHTRGAFSGATRDELGFVRASHGGTLLLDEIGELPLDCQTTLLRVLQESEVVPVGATRPVKVDLRVVSATHRRLAGVGSGAFRPDLYARLAGFSICLPALRERIEDLGIVLADMLASLPNGAQVTLSPELGQVLLRHSWPLNMRELHQALRTAIALAPEGALSVEHLPTLKGSAEAHAAVAPANAENQDGMDDEDARLRAALLARLHEHAGNVTAVARVMGKAPTQIHRWIKRYGIDHRSYRSD